MLASFPGWRRSLPAFKRAGRLGRCRGASPGGAPSTHRTSQATSPGGCRCHCSGLARSAGERLMCTSTNGLPPSLGRGLTQRHPGDRTQPACMTSGSIRRGGRTSGVPWPRLNPPDCAPRHPSGAANCKPGCRALPPGLTCRRHGASQRHRTTQRDLEDRGALAPQAFRASLQRLPGQDEPRCGRTAGCAVRPIGPARCEPRRRQ